MKLQVQGRRRWALKTFSAFLAAWSALMVGPGAAGYLIPAAHAQSGVKAAAFFFPYDAQSTQLAALVEHEATEAIGQQGGYVNVDVEKVLAGESARENETRITYGNQSFTQGRDAFAAMDMSTSMEKLIESVTFLEQAFPYLPRDGSFETALFYCGAASVMQGDPDTAKSYFERVLNLSPTYVPDPAAFAINPAITTLYDEVKAARAAGPKGSITVTSNPPAAEVYVDNIYYGVTPTEVPGLNAGEHYLVLNKKGYTKSMEKVLVTPGAPKAANINLTPTRLFANYQRASAQAAGEIPGMAIGPGITELGRSLFLDRMVLGTVTYQGTQIEVTAILVDQGPQQPMPTVVGSGTKQFNLSSPTLYSDIRTFVFDLFRGNMVSSGGSNIGDMMSQSKKFKDDQKKEQEKITDKWWFWTLIGVGVVAVAGGTTAGVLAASGGKEPPTTGSVLIQF
ncbi:MAG: hypothetical protein GMKNLPBB_01110 [Myxococcota bacterium]|nr:hypothetical protein [Myxococcota bacterium]